MCRRLKAKRRKAKITNLKRAKEFLDSPEWSKHRQEIRDGKIKFMLEQDYDFTVAKFRVRRSRNVIYIDWTFTPVMKRPEQFFVSGALSEIGLEPENTDFNTGIIARAHGNSSIQLELNEGCC